MDIKVNTTYLKPSCETVTVELENFCTSGRANADQMENYEITDGEW